MSNLFAFCTISLALLLVGACSNYDFTVNDRVVYSPDPLFTDFDVPDKALRQCIEDAINANVVTSARELSSLSCTDAGIKTLAGLATFTELELLTLSSNAIVDISDLRNDLLAVVRAFWPICLSDFERCCASNNSSGVSTL